MSNLKFEVEETPDTLCYRASCTDSTEDAQVFLLRAAAMNEYHVQTNYNLALIYQEWGNAEQAIIHFNMVRQYKDSRYHLGKLYRDNGNEWLGLAEWGAGSRDGCLKCQRELIEYYFGKIKIGVPDSGKTFKGCEINCIPEVITHARYNYMMGVYYLSIDSKQDAFESFSKSGTLDAKFMIWKYSLDTPVKNNQHLYEAAMAGHSESMFEHGKWLAETWDDFEVAVRLIIDSKFDGYQDCLFEIYKKHLTKKVVSLKQINEILPFHQIKELARIGEKTNLNQTNPDPDILKECAEQDLTSSKVRILIDMMCAGKNTTQQLEDLFQKLMFYVQMHDIDAIVQVAKCYNIGKGVEMDQEEATKWYRIAAEKGCRQAQNYLAWQLRTGATASRTDLEESKMWTNKCLELREGEKKVPYKDRYLRYLDRVDCLIKQIVEKEKKYKRKSSDQKEKDQFLSQATKLYNQAIEGDLEAAMLVGMVFGMTGMKDKNQEWFDKAVRSRESPPSKDDEINLDDNHLGERMEGMKLFSTPSSGKEKSKIDTDTKHIDEEEDFVDVVSGLD